MKKLLFIMCLCLITNISTAATCYPVGNSCTACISYRCNTGYFGSSTDGVNGCTSCAVATGNPSATSAKGSTLITDCYIPVGAKGNDASGSWEIVNSSCYYTK